MGPESAVQVAQDVRAKVLMPIHWGTYSLAMHPWKEPIERLIAEAEKKNVPLLIPAPGETVDVQSAPYNSQWWEAYR
jgi:L-ascorbate metabolism protein UlaG (beta-lactamase superfamily)